MECYSGIAVNNRLLSLVVWPGMCGACSMQSMSV